jgi:hypothetical protein
VKGFFKGIFAMAKVTRVFVASLQGIPETEEALFCAFRDANSDLASPCLSAGF